MSAKLRALFARADKPRQPHSARPQIESLEDRAVPAAVTLAGTAGNDQLFLRVIDVNGTKTLEAGGGAGATQRVALADVTSITVNGLAGDDTLTIDNSNGVIGAASSTSSTAALPITFNGGTGRDRLVLSGDPTGATVNETYNLGTSTGGGSIAITGSASATVTLSGVESVTDTLRAASLTINGTSGRDVLRLVSDGSTGGLRLESIAPVGRVFLRGHDGSDDFGDEDDDSREADARGDDNEGGDDNGGDRGDGNGGRGNNGNGNGPGQNRGLHLGHLRREDLDQFFGSLAVPISFANKAAVTINLGGGDDFLLLNATSAAGLTSLTVDGGGGTDVVAQRAVPSGLTPSYMNVEHVLTSLDQIFVEELYQLRLGRGSDEGGRANWLNALKSQGRRGVLNGILGSDEALGLIVNDLFVKLLNRPLDQTGRDVFVPLLRSTGSIELVITEIASSAEFANLAGMAFPSVTSPQEQQIRYLYQTLLQRPASDQEVASAVAAVANATDLRPLINGIVTSSEFRRLEVAALYQAFLNRLADEAGLNGWINSALNLLTIRSGLMESDEFFGSGS